MIGERRPEPPAGAGAAAHLKRWCRWGGAVAFGGECVLRLSAAGRDEPGAYESGGGQASGGALRKQAV